MQSFNWKTCLAIAGGGAALTMVWNRLREQSLRGEVALITGGSRGLGLLLARELAREGCRIAICARDAGELEAAQNDLAARGATVFAWTCDVSDRTQVEQFVADVTAEFGRIDILVNNAGIIQVGPLESMSADDFEQALDVMYWGMLHPTLAVLPQMRRRGHGRIVNITSIGGMIAVPHLIPYGCAKFAAVGLSQGLRAELAGTGICVTTVVPGIMRIGSHLNARFRGRAEEEFRWFSLGASLPLLSVQGERAARQIVAAVKRGQAVKFVGLPAAVAGRLHGLFPGATARVLSLANRCLLPAGTNGAARSPELSGMSAQEKLDSPVFDSLTVLGSQAARRSNQFH